MEKWNEEKWNEKKLNQELESLINDVPKTENLEKKIEEAIQRKIKKSVFRTITVLGIGVFVLILLVNPFLNAIFLNPYKLSKMPYEKELSKKTEENQDRTDEGYEKLSLYLGVLRDYCETIQPFTEVIDVEVKKKGFGRYELGMLISNRKSMLNIGVQNVWCDVEFGKYKNVVDPEHCFVHHYTYSYMAYQKEEYMEHMKKLPDSAIIYLTIGEVSPREYNLLKEDIEKKKLSLDWIQVYQPEVDFQGGLSINMHAAWKETDLRYKLSSDELKNVYISNLNSLIEHMEIWKPFGLICDNTQYYNEEQRLKETYENAKKMETLMCKKYSIFGEKADILSYFETVELEFFDIYGVKFSSFGY